MAAGTELEAQLKEASKKLIVLPPSLDELLPLLDQIECFLSKVEQSPSKSMQDALSPLTEALAAVELLRHSNVDVKVAVASCISEITRITAPDAPYDDDKMKDVFQLIVSSFENLPDKSSRSYKKRVLILETVAKVRSFVVMLDIECDGLITEMFQLFLGTIRDYHSENIFSSMETVMTLVLEESEDISPEILAPLLASVKKDSQEVLPVSVKLAEKVLQNCAVKLKPYLSHVIKSLDATIGDYSSVVGSICYGDSSVNRNDGNPSNEAVAMEDDSAAVTTDEAQETQLAEDMKNAVKEDDADPEVKLTSSTTLPNGVDVLGKEKDVPIPKGELSVNADDKPTASKVVFKMDADDLEAGKSSGLESKVENTAKTKGKVSNISTDIPTSSYPEVEGCPDQEKGKNGDSLIGSVREDKAVEAAKPMEDTVEATKPMEDTVEAAKPMEDTVENIPSLETETSSLETEAILVTSPSRTGSQPEQSQTKKTGRPKKKESLGHEDLSLENATEGTKDSESKPNKGKGAFVHSNNEDKISADVEDKDVEAARPMEEDTVENVPSPKALETEAVLVTSPSRTGSRPNESRTKKTGRPKKESLVHEDSSLKNAAERTKDSETKPNKGKGSSVHSNNEDKISADVEDKDVEAARPMEEDTVENVPSPKALETEAVLVTSPSRTGSHPNESRTKKTGRLKKKKESLVHEDLSLKNAIEGTKDSEAKPNKGKRASAHSNNEDNMSADVEGKSVETATPMEDTIKNMPSPKALETEAVLVTSPSRTGSRPEEGRTKNIGRPKKKESLVHEDLNLKNATEGAKDSKAKPNKGKRASSPSNNEDKISAEAETSKSGSGGTSDLGMKGMREIDYKVDESSNIEDATSSQSNKGGSKRAHGKVVLENEKTKSYSKDTKMKNSPKTPVKSAKDEAFRDETIGMSTKRKRSSVKDQEKATENIEYDDNLIGAKVEVYWPKDDVYYGGVIDSFDHIKNKHKIKYDDGDEEILNLKKETWRFIEDSDPSDEQASELASPDGASEMQKKKKAKKTSELSGAKAGKSGSLSSGKSKGGGVTKSGHEVKDDGNDPKLKDKSSKVASKSEDHISGKSTATSLRTSMKSREDDGSATKIRSKHENQNVGDKSKQDSQKIGTKSKGKTTQAATGGLSSNGSGKGKHSSLKLKETGDSKENQKEKSSYSTKTPKRTKAKLSDSNPQEDESGSTKKRRR